MSRRARATTCRPAGSRTRAAVSLEHGAAVGRPGQAPLRGAPNLMGRARLSRAPSGAREAELEAIWERASRIPPVDSRSDEEILGYSEHGTFD